MNMFEKYVNNVPWLEARVDFIRQMAKYQKVGIKAFEPNQLVQNAVDEFIELEKDAPLSVCEIPSGNIIWCFVDYEKNEFGDFKTKEEALKEAKDENDVFDVDLDMMWKVVDKDGKNVTGMLYPSVNRAWVFLYTILKPKAWRAYMCDALLRQVFKDFDKEGKTGEEKAEEEKTE